MTFRRWTLIRSQRTQSALRWCRYPLIIFGVLSLGYYGYVWLEAKLYQDYESRKFDQALKSLSASNASGQESRPSTPTPSPPKTEHAKTESRAPARTDGLSLGRIEICGPMCAPYRLRLLTVFRTQILAEERNHERFRFKYLHIRMRLSSLYTRLGRQY